jgi:hypothetical protein
MNKTKRFTSQLLRAPLSAGIPPREATSGVFHMHPIKVSLLPGIQRIFTVRRSFLPYGRWRNASYREWLVFEAANLHIYTEKPIDDHGKKCVTARVR